MRGTYRKHELLSNWEKEKNMKKENFRNKKENKKSFKSSKTRLYCVYMLNSVLRWMSEEGKRKEAANEKRKEEKDGKFEIVKFVCKIMKVYSLSWNGIPYPKGHHYFDRFFSLLLFEMLM